MGKKKLRKVRISDDPEAVQGFRHNDSGGWRISTVPMGWRPAYNNFEDRKAAMRARIMENVTRAKEEALREANTPEIVPEEDISNDPEAAQPSREEISDDPEAAQQSRGGTPDVPEATHSSSEITTVNPEIISDDPEAAQPSREETPDDPEAAQPRENQEKVAIQNLRRSRSCSTVQGRNPR